MSRGFESHALRHRFTGHETMPAVQWEQSAHDGDAEVSLEQPIGNDDDVGSPRSVLPRPSARRANRKAPL